MSWSLKGVKGINRGGRFQMKKFFFFNRGGLRLITASKIEQSLRTYMN